MGITIFSRSSSNISTSIPNPFKPRTTLEIRCASKLPVCRGQEAVDLVRSDLRSTLPTSEPRQLCVHIRVPDQRPSGYVLPLDILRHSEANSLSFNATVIAVLKSTVLLCLIPIPV